MKLLTILGVGIVFGGMMFIPFLRPAAVTVGSPAPDFSLSDDQGVMRSLSEFKGKKVALYFYPMDETPGCTAQACSIRDGYQALADQGIVIVGISFDSVASHKTFKEHHNLPFPLLSDVSKKVAIAYGAVAKFVFYAPVPSRKTFLIDEQGIVVKILDDIDVKMHADQIIQGFAQKAL